MSINTFAATRLSTLLFHLRENYFLVFLSVLKISKDRHTFEFIYYESREKALQSEVSRATVTNVAAKVIRSTVEQY